jgi:hypothetical protein
MEHQEFEVLRARRIEVVDAAGRMRIGLGVRSDGLPGLTLRDAAGRVRVGLVVLPEGTGLNLSDAAGRTRATLAVHPDGSPRFLLLDATGGRVLFRAP